MKTRLFLLWMIALIALPVQAQDEELPYVECGATEYLVARRDIVDGVIEQIRELTATTEGAEQSIQVHRVMMWTISDLSELDVPECAEMIHYFTITRYYASAEFILLFAIDSVPVEDMTDELETIGEVMESTNERIDSILEDIGWIYEQDGEFFYADGEPMVGTQR